MVAGCSPADEPPPPAAPPPAMPMDTPFDTIPGDPAGPPGGY
jgi:hypothetical protein